MRSQSRAAAESPPCRTCLEVLPLNSLEQSERRVRRLSKRSKKKNKGQKTQKKKNADIPPSLGVSLLVSIRSTWSTFCVNRVRKVEQPQHKQCSTSALWNVSPLGAGFFFLNHNFNVCCLVTRLELLGEFPPTRQEVGALRSAFTFLTLNEAVKTGTGLTVFIEKN